MCVQVGSVMLLWWLGLQDAGGGCIEMGGHADMDLYAWQQRQVHGRPYTASTCKISSWELWPVVQLQVFKANCQCDDHDIHLAAAMQ